MSDRNMAAATPYVHSPSGERIVTISPIAYKGVRVMTTEQLAEAYGADAKHLQGIAARLPVQSGGAANG